MELGNIVRIAAVSVVVLLALVVIVSQLHWALVWKARWQAEQEAERYAEELAAVRRQAQRDEEKRQEDVTAAYRAREAARHAAWKTEQVAVLRYKAVVAIRYRNGLLASKEAMTARRYSDWSYEVSCANMKAKAAIAKLRELGERCDENWLCQNFGPRV